LINNNLKSLLRTYNRYLLFAIIFTIVVTVAAAFIYSSLSKWQESIVEKNKSVCDLYAGKLYDSALEKIIFLEGLGLLVSKDLSSAEIKLVDSTLKAISERELEVMAGLDGGFYLVFADEFYGYSFPTSPPPVPFYGPPPRSYNIIKNQCLQSINENRSIIDVHSFDAAFFPLATRPIVVNTNALGVVWVRIHIENELPVIKLKRIVNVTALISIAGFLFLMLLSASLGGEINSIKKEMETIRYDSSRRLRKRWGVFGYITDNINYMLDTIEEEVNRRLILERQLNQKEKLASLGNMIAGVAHEVKTPLAIIKTRIQMWQKEIRKTSGVSDQISPESMQLVIDETNRLSTLVKRLLIFSRPIDKKMKPTDINKLIKEVVSFISMDTNEMKIAPGLDLAPDLPLILADESAIKEVIINILENSIEAMPEGGLINISTGIDSENDRLTIEVDDQGMGISEDIIDKVFDPFFSSKESGAGLGLSISYQIVKAHNGEITFLHNPGPGMKCIIKLPLSK
jgi:signal transduction histidine kinase